MKEEFLKNVSKKGVKQNVVHQVGLINLGSNQKRYTIRAMDYLGLEPATIRLKTQCSTN